MVQQLPQQMSVGVAWAKIAGNVAALPRETIWNQHSGKTSILRYGGTGSIGINLYTALSLIPYHIK